MWLKEVVGRPAKFRKFHFNFLVEDHGDADSCYLFFGI